MIDVDEELKRAIVNNDIAFFEANSNRIDINHRFEENNYDTLLLYALSDAKSSMHEYFLRKNADVTVINDEGEGVIHSIVYSGLPNRIDQVLKRGSCDINLKTKEGITPILLAVLLGKYEIFSRLLHLGADINIADNEGNVPLHPACFLGYKSMVIDLVENGANLLVKTNKGNYPLALAINGGHDEIVKFLFNHLYMGQ